jgi:hypothetical protein
MRMFSEVGRDADFARISDHASDEALFVFPRLTQRGKLCVPGSDHDVELSLSSSDHLQAKLEGVASAYISSGSFAAGSSPGVS